MKDQEWQARSSGHQPEGKARDVAHPSHSSHRQDRSWCLRAPWPLASCLPGPDTLVSSFLEKLIIPTLRVLFCK